MILSESSISFGKDTNRAYPVKDLYVYVFLSGQSDDFIQIFLKDLIMEELSGYGDSDGDIVDLRFMSNRLRELAKIIDDKIEVLKGGNYGNDHT